MTQKVSVTYKAPPGDAKVTEAYGHTFFDGKPEDIEVDDDTLAKIKGHPCFRTGGPEDAAKDKAGGHKGTDKSEKTRA
ncbi:hypothetical protein ABID65_006706 [Bradyrhizobium sp. S3.9.2]|uniref:hypothetical protein n=1 Tax=Bradyrhizobium sp. S3.9.2 TaxID=3156432 RepID=UPI003393F2F3